VIQTPLQRDSLLAAPAFDGGDDLDRYATTMMNFGSCMVSHQLWTLRFEPLTHGGAGDAKRPVVSPLNLRLESMNQALRLTAWFSAGDGANALAVSGSLQPV
jgi:hypothetical protein